MVMGPGYCVIMEVKNMSHAGNKPADPLVGTFRNSAEQKGRTAALIKGINEEATVLQFTAYPNFSREFED